MTIYELPCYGRQKSFYGKAFVIEDGATKMLRSYNTIVCRIEDGRFVRMWGGWSATTARHIDSFRIMNDMKPICKAEWDKMEVEGNG